MSAADDAARDNEMRRTHLAAVPRDATEMAQLLARLAGRIEHVVDGQLEHAHMLGVIMATLATLEGRLRDAAGHIAAHRGKLDSVPELVDDVLERRQLRDWRAYVGWGAKVLATVAAGVVLLYLGRFVK